MTEGTIHPDPSKPNDESVNSSSEAQSSAQSRPDYWKFWDWYRAAPETPEQAARRDRDDALGKTEREVLIPHVYNWQRGHGLPVGPNATAFPHGPIFPDMAARWSGWLLACHDRQQKPDLNALYPNAGRDGEWYQRRQQLIRKYLAGHPRDGFFTKEGEYVHDVIVGFGEGEYVALVGDAPWKAERQAEATAADEKAAEQRRQESVKAQIRQFHQDNGIAVAEEADEKKGSEITSAPADRQNTGRKTRGGRKPRGHKNAISPELLAEAKRLRAEGMSLGEDRGGVRPPGDW